MPEGVDDPRLTLREQEAGDTGPAVPEARLRELGVISREYAFFGRMGIGLGVLPSAVCLLAAVPVAWHEHRIATAILVGLAPPLAVLASAAARARYQRHGYADDSGAGQGVSNPTGQVVLGWFGWAMLLAWLGSTGLGLAARPDEATGRLAFASAATTTALLLWKRPRRSDGTWWLIAVLGHSTTTHALGPLALLFFGVSLAALGGWAHHAYLGVERRLLALREGG